MGKSVKLSIEELQIRLKERFPNLEFTSEYTGANDKIEITCHKCGHV